MSYGHLSCESSFADLADGVFLNRGREVLLDYHHGMAPDYRLTHRLPKWFGHPGSLAALSTIFVVALTWLVGYRRGISDYVNATAVVFRWVVVLLLGWLLIAAVMMRLRSRK